jgi:hypothetical protein
MSPVAALVSSSALHPATAREPPSKLTNTQFSCFMRPFSRVVSRIHDIHTIHVEQLTHFVQPQAHLFDSGTCKRAGLCGCGRGTEARRNEELELSAKAVAPVKTGRKKHVSTME